MFNLIFYIHLLCFLFAALFANTSELTNKPSTFPSTKDIYNNIKSRNDKLTPAGYQAVLQSPLINAQLKNLPVESRIFGKTPVVIFKFKKKQNLTITIENVESYQRSFFSIYEDILLRSGMLLGLGKWNEYPKFIKEHQMFLTINHTSKNHYYKVKVIEKEALPGDYGEYYFSQDWDLLFSKYFIDQKLSAKVVFSYRWREKYRLINKLHITLLERKQKKEFNLFFKKISYENH